MLKVKTLDERIEEAGGATVTIAEQLEMSRAEVADLMQALADSNQSLMEQMEIAQAANRQAEHWKANHGDVVARLKIATERPDLPVDRIPSIKELERLQALVGSKQAEIDRLMLEYCPDEMSDEQMATWEAHQREVSARNAPKIEAMAAAIPDDVIARMAAQAQSPALPSTPEEAVAFIGPHFEILGIEGPIMDRRITLSVHDLLSAFRDWQYFPPDAAPQQHAQAAQHQCPKDTPYGPSTCGKCLEDAAPVKPIDWQLSSINTPRFREILNMYRELQNGDDEGNYIRIVCHIESHLRTYGHQCRAAGFEEGKRLANEQACTVTHRLMAERDEANAKGRAAALEEAAKVCEAQAQEYAVYRDHFPHRDASNTCAAAIRELNKTEGA